MPPAPNRSDADRIPYDISSPPYVKQQFDYVSAVGDEFVPRQSDRVQQLPGCYARMVTSLEECYVTSGRRLPVRSGLSHGRSEARA
jgi:hypothetical protein